MYYFKHLHRTIELYKANVGDLDSIKEFSDKMKNLLTYKYKTYNNESLIIMFKDFRPLTIEGNKLYIDQKMYDILWKYVKNMEQDDLIYIWKFYIKEILNQEFESIVIEKYLS